MPEATRWKTGAKPTPRYRLAAATPFTALAAPPAQIAYVPERLDAWGNDDYGDCVSAEEAFAKACYEPEIFIPAPVVISWARERGWLNGAYLEEVMAGMKEAGFQLGAQRYNDGAYYAVNYSDQKILQAAIAVGPVKIAIDHNALPSNAGSHQGWFALAGSNHPETDHCVAICGYGGAKWLYEQLRVPLPNAIAPTAQGYLVYTWATIGFVSHAWLMGTCVEAWVRNPTTVGVPPLAPPAPPTPPTPPTPPPVGSGVTFVWPGGTATVPAGVYTAQGSRRPGRGDGDYGCTRITIDLDCG